MIKFLATISAFLTLFFLIFFKSSTIEDHSFFYISGENLHEIAKSDGSFGSAPAFLLIEKISLIKNKILTGEYKISKGETILSVIIKMIEGKRVIRKLTIPEGYTVKMILEVIQNNNLLFGNFSRQPKEGSLMPNTYFYYFGDSKDSILQKMKNQMDKLKSKLSQMNKTNMKFDDILTLASIIEKESGNANELNLISSVFHNRLAIKMRLQSDPTVVYGISNGYGKLKRKLTRKDLWFESPYNTYRNAGIPPTPICCPGENAIMAAMNPLKTDFLYFVANKNLTGHVFSKDYNSHLKEVKNFRKKLTKN